MKFGTAGIRGIFGQDVSMKETLAVCFAVNEFVGEGKFGIGYDTRDSSFVLAKLACAAMNWYGSEVEDYGVIPTPVLAYTIKRSNLHAGFSVTASHNPPEYAGVKVFGASGIEFSLEQEHRLEELMQRSSGYIKRDEELAKFGGTFNSTEAIQAYNESVTDRAPETNRKFKILIDCINGTSLQTTPRILSRLGHRVVTVNSHASANFPGRLPEPSVETLGEVGKLTRLSECDFGVAHDGDADRVVLIDGDGSVIPDYAVSVLVLKTILEKAKRGTVVLSYNASDVIESVATQNGCTVRRSRLGKTFQELYKRNGIFACEPSKMVDPRWGFWEDGIYCAMLVVQYLSREGITLHEALLEIPKCYDFRKDLVLPNSLDYDLLVQNIERLFQGSIDSVEDADGIKVRFRNNKGWLMVRVSGTEKKKVRIYSESFNESEAKELLGRGTKLAQESQRLL